MAIKLRDIWAIEKPSDYKVHFARHNRHEEPLEVWLRNPTDWKKWQEYRPARDEFNRPLIFSLMRFYHEPDVWLFGGVFRVLARREDAYEVELTKQGDCFIGCLKLRSVYRNRNARPRLEDQYDQFEVHEILRAPYTGRPFPGHENIDLSFEELETLNRTGRDDWKVALENIKGVYLITDENLAAYTLAPRAANTGSGRVGRTILRLGTVAMLSSEDLRKTMAWTTAVRTSVSHCWSITLFGCKTRLFKVERHIGSESYRPAVIGD